MLSILGNYAWFRYLDGTERLDFPELKALVYGQEPSNAEVKRLPAATRYSAWRWEHDNPLIWFNNARTILHTYRNPLDNFVSRYYWFYVNRDNSASVRQGATLQDAIELDVPPIAWHYASVRDIARRANVHRVAYEDLIREPAATAREALRFAFRPDAVDDDALRAALHASSADNVVADEKRHGLTDGNLVGQAKVSFIRSGAIGEWRDVLAGSDVARIEQILAAHRVSLDEFVLE
jgi:hypothetical protein